MAKLKGIDKPCEACGALMVDAPPMRRFCNACADKRNKANKDRRRRIESRLNMSNVQMSPIQNPNRKYCKGCYYWGGLNGSCDCCNYIFVEGRKRPCPPGKGCTVRKEKE